MQTLNPVSNRRVRNFVISGTNYWNPGDDFVRDGVIHVLRQIFPGDHLNFHFYNFGEDQFPKSKFRGIGNEVSAGDLELCREFIDGVIVAGLSAGHEIKDLYHWVLANGLEDRVYLIGAGYENSYCAEHVLEEPEATVFRKARLIIGRTERHPRFIDESGVAYVHLNCPALLSVPQVKQIEEGRKIRRIGFSIQLPHEMGIVNQTCDATVHRLACRLLLELKKTHEVELVAHHKTEYFFFLHLLRDTEIPVIYSSFYRDLHDAYRGYDCVVTTRLHSSLYANGHGIPGIIVNDTDRHTHTLAGFPHSSWVNTQEAFDREFVRLQQSDLVRIAAEMKRFKETLALKYVDALKPVFAGKIVGQLSSRGDAKHYQFDSEKKEQLLVRSLVKPGMTVLDVGAHVGKYTKLFSLIVGQQGRVFSFEPTPASARKLADRIEGDSLANVTLIRKAVCDHNGIVTLHQFPEEYSSWNGLGRPSMEDPRDGSKLVPIVGEVEVAAITLDEFCRSQELNRIDYLKLDVEGAEIHALHGAVDLLKRQAIGCLQFEVSRKMLDGLGTSARNVFQFLAGHGYECHSIRDDGTIGQTETDSEAFFDNYIAFPAKVKTTINPAADLPINFFTIVLNGGPFIRHHIEALQQLPFQWHWHIVEGVAELKHDTAWSVAGGGRVPEQFHKNGLSIDGTTGYLDELKQAFPDRITIHRAPASRFWDGKREMVNAPLAQISGECLLWQLDADEIWTATQIARCRALFLAHPEKTAAMFFCHYFVGPDRVITSRNTYGNHTAFEWLRVWRFQPGDRWVAHEPPRLGRVVRGAEPIDVGGINPILHSDTEAMGLVFQHYAYATEAQVQFKQDYYGYPGAVEQWHKLQEASGLPCRLADYFAWVKDGATVDLADSRNIEPLIDLDVAISTSPQADVSPKRILFVRTDSIGDVVLASSMLEPIRRRHPEAQLAVLCQEHVAGLFVTSPFVNTVICYDRTKMETDDGQRELLADITQYQPDLILNSVRSRDALSEAITHSFPSARRVGIQSDLHNIDVAARDQSAQQYDQIVVTTGETKPELAHHAAFLRGLGIAARNLQPVVWTHEDDEHLAEAFFRQHGLDPLRTMAVFPFTQHGIKNYPSFAAALAGYSGWTFLVFGGAEVQSGCEELTGALPGQAFNLAGRTSLREMAALIRRCRILVGSDSCGPHIACAVGVPNVVVLGGGHPGRFFPYSPLTSVAALPLPCSGCNWACKFPTPHCITDITPDFVADVIRRSLASHGARARVFLHPSDKSFLIEGGAGKFFAETDVEIIGPAGARKAEPVVSVLVSTYAAEKYLRACLDDIEAQTIAEKLEVIVIDSGSPENERAIVEEYQTKYSNIRYVRTEREPLYVAWNRGVKMARGRYVVNANTDDSRRPDAFQILLEAMETHTDAGLAYAHYGMSDAPNDPFPPRAVFRNVRHDPYHPGQLLFYCITGCLQFWRKSALEKVGGFDESLKCVGDYEILLRLMRQGMKPVLVPEILSTFFINRKGLSFGSDTAFKEDIKVKDHYRNVVEAGEIFSVDSSNPREMAKAWINLGNMAAAVSIPWDDQPHSCPEYAISCYQKAVACDAGCNAAWHNLAALSIRMGITDYLAKTFRSAQPGIDDIIAKARLNRDLIGFDLPPKVDGHYFQRAGIKLETTAAVPISQHQPKGESTSPRGLVVSWEGSYLDLGSLSHINRQLTDRLSVKKDLTLVAVGANAIPPSMRHDREWKSRSRKLRAESPADVAVTVRHQWPPDWSRPARGALVVIQPWEFGALPIEWVQAAAHVDEFWVPSQYVRSVYVSSGVDPSKVQVIPNGVDVRRYRAAAKPLHLETKKRFKFLFVGGTIGRKGPDVLLQAYLQSFSDADDVCLVIKDFGGSGVYQGQTMGALIEKTRQQPGAPEILHLTQELSPEQMPGLFTACDCLVHPYRGEGFGLPILEAMACARPVIVTRGGAVDDFVTGETGWFIDSTRRSIGTTVSRIPLVAEGWLLEPDVNHLAKLLRQVAANPVEAKIRGAAGARLAREKYDWSIVTSLVANRLKLVAQRFAEKSAGASTDQAVDRAPVKRTNPLPRCASIGSTNRAMELLARKNLAEAWKAACTAVEERPFNPPAWHLLGKISLVFGDIPLARRCVEILRTMTPAWSPVKKLADSLAGRNDGQPCGFKLPAISSQPRLSVCLIVKNEERFLASCLKSVQGLAHQIVVVDTGSQDRTIEIAKNHGAEIHTFKWCDDFSAARNAALEHATGDWILVLDADEELSNQGREVLREELQNPAAMAYRLPIVEADRLGEGCHYVPRLFRNAPGVYFSGRIHENAFGYVEVLRSEWGLENRLGKAELIHHGYSAAVTRSRDKVARNRRLLELALQESPDDANLLMNLGLELVRSRELAPGIEKYLAAFRLLAPLPADSVVPELRETLLTQLSTHLLAAGRFHEIVTILQSPLATQADLTASLHFVMGLASMELKQHRAAADHFRSCLAKRNERGLTPINSEIRKAAPNHCLGLSLLALKQWPEAEQAFQAALVDEPGSVAVRLDLARFWVSQGGPVDALKLLHEMISDNAGDPRIWLFGAEIALGQPELLEFAVDWTGEAVKHVPRNREIALQRAEALLLSGKIEQARSIFRLHRDPENLRALAALALIELIADAAEPCFALKDQAVVGREFVHWYRRLLACDAGPIIEAINVRLPQLRAILPAAAAALDAALADAVA